MSIDSINCARCEEPMDDDPDAEEGELCCRCETEDLNAARLASGQSGAIK